MKVGDLVMWIGKDQDHGQIGVIAKVYPNTIHTKWYDVQWSDGVFGEEIHHLELMAVNDESG